MSTIIDYVKREQRSFSQLPFNSVDSLVLSQLIYLNFKNIVSSWSQSQPIILLKDILTRASLTEIINNEVRDGKQNKILLQALLVNPRFNQIGLNYYQVKIDLAKEEQFTAITYFLDTQTAYIAFSGTGASFIGWKENFNMAFVKIIPSQEDGLAYVKQVLRNLPNDCRFMLGGHSKGGNIALYAGMNLSFKEQKHLLKIYSHDGPGFHECILSSQKYAQIKNKISVTVAQASVVGLLLAQYENYQVVQSQRLSLMQHDPFSWLVKGNDFIYASNHAVSALSLGQTINQWVEQMPNDKKALFINTLYQVIEANRYDNCQELSIHWYKETIVFLKQVQNLDPQTRNFILQTIKALITLAIKNFCQLSFTRE